MPASSMVRNDDLGCCANDAQEVATRRKIKTRIEEDEVEIRERQLQFSFPAEEGSPRK